MDLCERIAKTVIEQLIPKSRMVFKSQQCHGEYDFDLIYPDGRKAAVEVTAAKDESLESLKAALWKENPLPRKKCKNDWIIVVTKKAHINKIRQNIDSYLAEVEKEGREEFFAYVDSHESLAVQRILEDLQVEAGWIVKKSETPGIGILGPTLKTIYNPKEVDIAILREAQKIDNRRKLGSFKLFEKHLFICIDWSLYGPWYAINEGKPSGLPIELPPEIDIVWAVAPTRSQGTYTVWRAEREKPWEVLGEVCVSMDQ